MGDVLSIGLEVLRSFAPWVNKVYLVTDNQTPDWLDVDNSKLEVIDHKEIINNDYLLCFRLMPLNVIFIKYQICQNILFVLTTICI